MTWTGELLAGIAQHLADTAGATWRPSGSYTTGDVWPVVIIAVPAAPDAVLVLTPYTVAEAFDTSDVTQGVQVRTRGTRDPRTVWNKTDDVFGALHGLRSATLGGIPVISIERASASYLGVDTNGRHEHTANYYVQAARPSTHRTD